MKEALRVACGPPVTALKLLLILGPHPVKDLRTPWLEGLPGVADLGRNWP
jgi:hypothetical protein